MFVNVLICSMFRCAVFGLMGVGAYFIEIRCRTSDGRVFAALRCPDGVSLIIGETISLCP